jgi:hypothetical protein
MRARIVQEPLAVGGLDTLFADRYSGAASYDVFPNGRELLMPRAVDPHSSQGNNPLQQDVVFQTGIERRRPILRSAM